MAACPGNTIVPSPQSARTPAYSAAGESVPAEQGEHAAGCSKLRKVRGSTDRRTGSCRYAGIGGPGHFKADLNFYFNRRGNSDARSSRPPRTLDSQLSTLRPKQRHPSLKTAAAFRISGRCPRPRCSCSDRGAGFRWLRANGENRQWQSCPRRSRDPRRSPLALSALPERWPAGRDRNQHCHFIFQRRGFRELPFQLPSQPLAWIIRGSTSRPP